MSLRALLDACNDDTLAALPGSSPGLVKRARKDLEKETPPPPKPDGEGLQVVLAEHTVTLRAPLERSTCPCPATGVCRHLLAAFMHARGATDETASDPAEEIRALDATVVRKWAPAALRKKAAKLGAPEFETGAVLVARFPAEHAECRFLPGSSLEASLCSCEARNPCAHRVAAVLALRGELPPPEEALPEASAGAPRTREEILEALEGLLATTLAGGLCRMSPGLAERLVTLAAAAHGTEMPNLERLLRTLAGEADRYRSRQAGSSSSRVLALAARAEAMREALKSPTSALLGRHRREYRPLGEVELAGMGGRQWRTPGGHRGLTVFFRAGAEWLTWSSVQPEPFEPAHAWRGTGPWTGCPSPAVAAASRLRLRGGNRAGERLGSPQTARCLVLGPTRAPEPVRDWAELRPPLSAGLEPPGEAESLALVAPARWEPGAFDPALQELHREVRDESGAALLLRLPWLPWTSAAVRRLEGPPGQAVLGRLHRFEGRLALEPYVLFEEGRPVSLTLESEGAQTRVEGAAEPPAALTPLGLLLANGLRALEEAAEAGPAALPPGRLRRLGTELATVGLDTPARHLQAVAEAIARLRQDPEAPPSDAARALLRAAWVLDVAARLEEG